MLKNLFANKIGIIIGAIVAILLVGYHMFSMPAHDRQEMPLSGIGLSMMGGVILGGAISGFLIENYYIHKLTRIGSIWGCIIGSILISPLSLFLGIVWGAALGLRISGFVFAKTKAGIPIEIFIGIMLTIIIIESIGAMIGAALGSLGESLARHFSYYRK